MQPVAGRRALSYLASKLHPRVPLSPRESAQLLNLLTTSFRAHLDRVHPLAETENGRHETKKQSLPPVPRRRARSVPPANLRSSHTSASDHIESILTNPLFAARPGRRASDVSKADAQSVLRDPLGWFLDQVAIGAADLSKAAICLEMLRRDTPNPKAAIFLGVTDRPKVASHIANWLQCSGPDTWSAFISYEPAKLLHPLTILLLREGDDAILWNWFASPRSVQETDVEEANITAFRAQLLKYMVATKTYNEPHIDEALSVFLRAYKMAGPSRTDLCPKIFQPAGIYLVNCVLSRPKCALSPELYESFLQIVKACWKNPRSIQSMLWLHHPTEPSALPAISYIRDPKGLTKAMARCPSSRRKFFVHLCLGIARQSLAEKRFDDAQFALEFARDAFPDLVGSISKPLDSSPQAEEQKDEEQEARDHRRREEETLRMLDKLLPT